MINRRTSFLFALVWVCAVCAPAQTPTPVLAIEVLNSSVAETDLSSLTVGETVDLEISVTTFFPCHPMSHIDLFLGRDLLFLESLGLETDANMFFTGPGTPSDIERESLRIDLGNLESIGGGQAQLRYRCRLQLANTVSASADPHSTFSARFVSADGHQVSQAHSFERALPTLKVAARIEEHGGGSGDRIHGVWRLDHEDISSLAAHDVTMSIAIPEDVVFEESIEVLSGGQATWSLNGTSKLTIDFGSIERDSGPTLIRLPFILDETFVRGERVFLAEVTYSTILGDPGLALDNVDESGERTGSLQDPGSVANNLVVDASARFDDFSRFRVGFEDRAFVVQTNDFDFNDLVLDVDTQATYDDDGLTELAFTVEAVARGAADQHRVDLRLGIAGPATIQILRYNASGQLLSQESRVSQGEFIDDFVVFPSSTAALVTFPGFYWFASNTSFDQTGIDRISGHRTEIVVTVHAPSLNPRVNDSPTTPAINEHIEALFGFKLHLVNSGVDVITSGAGRNGTKTIVSREEFPDSPIVGLPIDQSIILSVDSKWPLERIQIWDAYPRFSEFVMSGGRRANDWYLTPDLAETWPRNEAPSGGLYVPLDVLSVPAPDLSSFAPVLFPSAITAAPLFVDVFDDGTPELAISTFETQAGLVSPSSPTVQSLTDLSLNATSSSLASFAFVDVNLDGVTDLVKGDENGRMRIWDPTSASGQTIFAGPNATKGKAAVGDVNNNGREELVIVTGDGNLHALAGAPLPGFPVQVSTLADQGHHYFKVPSPALAQLIPGAGLEIICATLDGQLTALDGTGNVLAGFPIALSGPALASPAVGDLDGNGTLEIVAMDINGLVTVVTMRKGRPSSWSFKIPYGGGVASPALADLDGDGDREIIVVGRVGEVHVVDMRGQAQKGWPKALNLEILADPVVADLGGSQALEIVVAAPDGLVTILNHRGQIVDRGDRGTHFPFHVASPISASPIVVDFDGDGFLEVVVGDHSGRVWRLPTQGKAEGGSWPEARRDRRNSGTR